MAGIGNNNLNPNNPNNDAIVANSPNDTISSLLWSPQANFLSAASWNKDVIVWDIANNGTATPKLKQTHQTPVLCSAWSGDNTRIFTGGCDNKAYMWTLQSNALTQVAQHQAPIKEIAFINELNLLVTGSWDKTVKYWDMRQQSNNAALTVSLDERVYCMDMKAPVLVVGTAAKSKNLLIFDLTNPNNLSRPYRTVDSPLKYQSRCVSIFPDRAGFAVGSIEGRVGIIHVHEKDTNKNFAFKCHREGNEVYAVNSIAFHNFGTFATAGADGRYTYWDKDAKQRLKQFERASNSITAASFNASGNIYAYALGYDWSKGVEFAEKHKQPCGVLLHPVQEAEIKKKEVQQTNKFR